MRFVRDPLNVFGLVVVALVLGVGVIAVARGSFSWASDWIYVVLLGLLVISVITFIWRDKPKHNPPGNAD